MKAYIFDLDGTLFDSMSVWDDLNNEFCAKRGIANDAEYTAAVRNMSLFESAEYTIKRYNLPDTVAELTHTWNGMTVHAYTHTVEMKPGAKAYLMSLRERGVRLAVATSLPAQLYEPALAAHGIRDWFDAVSDAEQAGAGKTKPDMYLLAAKKLGVTPADCVVFDDILAAVKSAKSIGMTVCGVYDPSSEDDWDGIKNTADFTIRDFGGLPEELL